MTRRSIFNKKGFKKKELKKNKDMLEIMFHFKVSFNNNLKACVLYQREPIFKNVTKMITITIASLKVLHNQKLFS